MNDLILALDFGGTKLSAAAVQKSALFDENLAWHRLERAVAPLNATAQSDIKTMIALGKTVLDGRAASAVGISFGGPADFDTGLVIRSDHVTGWEGVALQWLMEEAFGAPTRIDNDANIAALGEWRFGAARGVAHLLYITISTGVGAGWVLNSQPWRGRHRMAGEIGHVVVDPEGPVCLCGKRGCVERFASGPYMAQDAADLLALRPAEGQILRALVGDSAVTGFDVAQAAAQGDELAAEVLQRGAWALGVAIGNVANLMDIDRFVLGGGVTKSGSLWWETVRASAEATALPDVAFEVVAAQFQDDAPLWGGVALVADLAA